MPPVLGLDIGGANLKAVHQDGTARIQSFPLWKLSEELAAALASLIAQMPPHESLAITMTGELCDCFATKKEGVYCILNALQNVAAGKSLLVWTTDGEFVSPRRAFDDWLKVAASNWHALATYTGRFAPDGAAVLIDNGSTTTDIIPLLNGTPVPTGKTDTDRLRSSELVYTGVRRTPLCALLGSTVMAELFAATLDVYLLLGDLQESEDDNTADGRPANKANAHSRIARMIGGDGELCTLDETMGIARKAASTQESLMRFALRRVLRALPAKPAKIILSGEGEFLAQRVLQKERFAKEQFLCLSEHLGPSVSNAACAHAVAVLAGDRHHAE